MTLLQASEPGDVQGPRALAHHLEDRLEVGTVPTEHQDQALDPLCGAVGTGVPDRAPEVVTSHLALLAQLAREWRNRATHGELDRLSVSDAQLLDSLARDLLPAPGATESMAKLAARDALEKTGRDAARAQDDLRRAVALFRKRGGTWAEVGALFGITRQAAAKRFAPVDVGRRYEAPAEVPAPEDDPED